MFDPKKSAASIKARSRKEVTLPEGGEPVEIRKLTPRDFVSAVATATAGVDIPTAALVPIEGETPEHTRRRILSASPEAQEAVARVLLTRGVLAPKIIIDDEPLASDGEVNANDLGTRNIAFLIQEVIEFSGLGEEARAVERFREGDPEQPSVARPDGATVRESAA